jgi:nucleoside-diphosphate-sugar epimerase
VNGTTALVTGGAGFIGRRVVKVLSRHGFRVRAGIHRQTHNDSVADLPGVQTIPLDILDRNSLMRGLEGVDVVYHFAALVNARKSREDLYRTNVEGTRNVWSCAAACDVKRALYCSSAAVYGLLAKSPKPISEGVQARAVEPYGNSKLLGESAAFEIAARSGPPTVVIRPVAVFGPGEHTPFGKQLRDAAVSKLLLAGGFQKKRFSFVHAEDVAEAAVHLMHSAVSNGQIFNVAVDEPILFEDALQAYIRVLGRAGLPTARTKRLASVSSMIHKMPGVSHWLSRVGGSRFVFTLWHPGFDLTYSSSKLLGTSFRFKWGTFEDVLLSCIDGKA